MADLPFLVVHGALIAKLAVALIASAWFAFVMISRRQRERRRTHHIVAARAVALTALVPGFASLRGRLHGTACTLTEIEGVTGDAGHERSDPLFVDVAGARVELTGTVRVVRGTHATAGWRALPSGTPGALRQVARRGRRRMFAIDDGAEVIAQGVLERGASDTGYRDDAGTWVMRAALGAPASELVAMQPKSVAIPLGPILVAVWAGVCFAVTLLALSLLGALLVDDLAYEDTPPVPIRVQLAAALPWSREVALMHAAFVLQRAQRDAPTFAQLGQLRALTDGCAGLASWLFDHERDEEAQAIAHGCHPGIEVRALVRLGRYAEAADLVAAAPDALNGNAAAGVEIAIGASRWADAASAAARVADEIKSNAGASADVLDSGAHLRITRVRCMVAWFRSMAGDHAARGQLAQLAADSVLPGCLVADALQQAGAPRTGALDRVRRLDGNGPDGQLARALLWADGDPAAPPALAPKIRGAEVDPWVWLAPQTTARGGDSVERLDGIRGRHAIHTMQAGATHEALAEAQSITGSTHGDITAIIALRTPTTSIPTSLPWAAPPADDELSRAIAARRGERSAPRDADGDCMRGVEAALPDAISGDGGPLAGAISTACHDESGVDEAILGAVARVVAHRPELGEALALYNRKPAQRDELPFQLVAYAALRRDVLRLTGDTAAAARWQARVDAQLAMLADRQRTIAFLLWRR